MQSPEGMDGGNGRASRDRPETHPAIAPRTADGRKLGKFLSRADLSDCSPAERLFKRALPGCLTQPFRCTEPEKMGLVLAIVSFFSFLHAGCN